MGPRLHIDDPTLLKIGNYCRSNLDVSQGACFDRRVEYFHGDEMVDLLVSKSFKKKKFLKLPDEMTRSMAMEIADRMLESQSQGFFHKANIKNKYTKSVDYDELDQMEPAQHGSMEDDDDAVYIWILAPSQLQTVLYSAGLIVVAIAFCMIKVWPLWMKIAVWWCSLIMLVCMLSLLVIRIFVGAIFWVVGFRGLWLLPNMLNDDLDFLDAFSPLVGYGTTSREIRLNAKAARVAAMDKVVKKKNSKGKQQPAPAAEEAEATQEESKEGKHECDFGMLNLGFILIAGILLCNYLGLFMPENIPEFVTSRADLFAHFPSLAPPDYNATAEALAAEAAAAMAESSGEGPLGASADGTSADGVKIPGLGESEDIADDDIIDDVKDTNEKLGTKFESEEVTEDLD